MKVKKQITAALLAACMTAASLAGCSSGSGGQTSQPVGSTDESKSSKVESTVSAEPMPIEWLSFYGPETNDTYPQKYLEEKFNIKITNMLVDRNTWKEQLNVKLAGGDIPDIFWTWGAQDLAAYAAQGVLAEVTREKIEEKMPIYCKSVEEIEPRLWFGSQADGKNYGVPLYWENGKTPQIPAYNKAWLDKIGAAVPKTLDEFVDVLTKFTNGDPDGNGKKDTYGISFRGKDSPVQSMLTIYGAYGVNPVDNYVLADDGETICPPFMTQAWKDATALIQKLYKDGIIDPESITDDNAQITQKFANGRVGVQGHGLWYHWIPVTGGYRIATDNAGVEVVFGSIPTIEGSKREASVYSGGVVNSPIGFGVQLEKDTAKLDKCLEILEALHSDEEVYLATGYGKAGEHYDMVDGLPVRRPELGDAIQQGTKYGVGAFYGMFLDKSSPMIKYAYTPEALTMRDEFVSKGKLTTPYTIGNTASVSKYPDITNYLKESLIKFIIGELNLEGDLEKFKSSWLEQGGEVLMAEMNAMYKEQNK